MTKEQALHTFWSSFNLTAYDENTVPDGAQAPYITYEVSTGDFDNNVALSADVWYKSNSWSGITNKANEISQKIGMSGILVPYDQGALWIKKASPFSQRLSDDSDKSVRRIHFNVYAEYISAN